MQLYIGDYLRDTRHLTTEQHGAYLLLLMAMWTAGGRLPKDENKLARYAGCTPSRWARIGADVIEFFTWDGEHLTSKRLSLELGKASEKAIKRAHAGKLGAEAKALKNNKRPKANGKRLLKHLPEPEPEREVRDTPPLRGSPPTETDLFPPIVPEKPVATKATRLAPGWIPTQDDLAFAAKQGLTREDTFREADKFRDYWLAASRNAAKLDWAATWRNWVRTASDSRKRGGGAGMAGGSQARGSRWGAGGMGEIIARRRSGLAD